MVNRLYFYSAFLTQWPLKAPYNCCLPFNQSCKHANTAKAMVVSTNQEDHILVESFPFLDNLSATFFRVYCCATVGFRTATGLKQAATGDKQLKRTMGIISSATLNTRPSALPPEPFSFTQRRGTPRCYILPALITANEANA